MYDISHWRCAKIWGQLYNPYLTPDSKNGQLLDLDEIYSTISLTRPLAKIPSVRYKQLRMCKNLRLTAHPVLDTWFGKFGV